MLTQSNKYVVWLLLICICWPGSPLLAQDKLKGKYEVLFASGTRELPENIDNFLKDIPLSSTDYVKGHAYCYIQFEDIPTQEQRERINASGLLLLEYIPYKVYIAALPKTFDLRQLKTWNVRSIVPIKATDKLDQTVIGPMYPEWADFDDRVEVLIQYHRNLTDKEVRPLLLDEGVAPSTEYDTDMYIRAFVQKVDIQRIAGLPYVNRITAVQAPAIPDSREGRTIHRSYAINTQYPSGRHYDGTGVTVAVNDDGYVGPHIDFKGRTDQTDVAGDFVGDHGDMVSGILGGAGNIDPAITGMAPNCFLFIRQYNSSMPNTVTLHQNDNVMIFSTSYSNGCNDGYTSVTQQIDQEIFTNPALLQVFSAGNSGTSDCSYGAGAGWGNITGGHKMAKSVITTANVERDGLLVGSSSRGPADDGRIKPDIAAHGRNQLSTDPNNQYSPGGGTSAAAPGIAGCMAQLYQAYREFNGGANPNSGLMKAAMLNTAQDYGNVGPDFQYGWGLVNAYRALLTLENQTYWSGTINQGGQANHTLTIPAGVSQARIMLYWMDPAGSTSASQALVNDLDLSVTAGGTYLPWVLDPTPNAANLNTPATTGTDNLNNVEQVVITNPAATNATVTITGAAVPQGPQEYFIVYEFIYDEIMLMYPLGGEGLIPLQTERIHWDAYGNSGSFTLQYTTNNGSSWTTIATVAGSERGYDWTVPNLTTGQARVRVSRSGLSDESDANFSIVNPPANLNVSIVCPTYLRLEWDAVGSATSYDVFYLGTTHMDSVGTTSGTSFDIPITDPDAEHWVSVRAVGSNGLRSRRAIAISHTSSIINCPLPNDVLVSQMITPSNHYVDCSSTSAQITVQIQNNHTSAISNIPVGYQLAGGSIVTETFTGTIAGGGGTANHTFSTPVNFPSSGLYDLAFWTSLGIDSYPGNDTLNEQVEVHSNGSLATLPMSDDLESYGACGTASDCEAEVCVLGTGWRNATNGIVDDIDWRIDEGGTPSVGTGPSVDYSPGTGTGHYLYLEASAGCNGQSAMLISPCIDLTGTITPTLQYAYHMYGVDMGQLHVDIFDGSSWVDDVVPFSSGNQGDVWLTRSVNLSAYAGSQIVIRLRGVTGFDYESDLAIDDLRVVDLGAVPPTAGFTASTTALCGTNSSVTFTDNSLGTPTTWTWSFSPNTVTFLNGTSANSQNPEVQFNSLGAYDVTLTVSNTSGNNSTTNQDFIQVNNAVALPLNDNLETYGLCGTSSNCAAEVCPLGGGWRNEANGATDDIDWRIDEGGTPSVGTGPSTDYNPGSTIGNYLYLEASSGCNGQVAMLTSPCIDLSAAVNPSFSYAYHMYGLDMGELHVDLYDGDNWVLDITPAVSGNRGDVWNTQTIDLSPYIGSSIILRMRGITGSNYESDLALDDFQLIDNVPPGPPTANFSVVPTSGCPGTISSFTDLSTNVPTSWNWSISPATYTFVNGTDASSQNPELSFTAGGEYTVTLIAMNSFGSDTLTQANIVSIGGVPVPLMEDLESFTACGTASDCETEVCALGNGWINETNGVVDDIDWRVDAGGTPSVGTGPTIDYNPGTATGNYLYIETSASCDNRTAILTSPCLDLTGINSPIFSFAYHMFGTNIGSLHIDLHDGTSWTSDFAPPITGNQGDAWYTQSVDLSAYENSIISLRLRAISGVGFESDIAIDDLQVTGRNANDVHLFSMTQPNTSSSICPSMVSPGFTFINEGTAPITSMMVHYGFMGGSLSTYTVSDTSFASLDTFSVNVPAIQMVSSGDLIAYTSMPNGVVDENSTNDSISLSIMVAAMGSLPIDEDFQSGTFPSDWAILNPDDSTTWAVATGLTHPDCSPGNTNTAYYLNNYNYNRPLAEDILELPIIDLTHSASPMLTFDYAHAGYSSELSDSMRIDIRPCNGSPTTLWGASGFFLSTTIDTVGFFSPGCSQWANVVLDLSSYIGQEIVIQFVAVNDYGNNLYLDNINVTDSLMCGRDVFESNNDFLTASPLPLIGAEANASICPEQDIDIYSFHVQSDKPHLRLYLSDLPADYNLELYDATQTLLAYSDTMGTLPEEIVWNNLQTGMYYARVYGVNDAASGEAYRLRAQRRALPFAYSAGTFVRTTDVSPETSLAQQLSIYPNPAHSQVFVSFDAGQGEAVQVQLSDITGHILRDEAVVGEGGLHTLTLSLDELPQGIYLIKAKRGEEVLVRKVVKE